MINFAPRRDWKNVSEGGPETVVYKEDLLRYENALAAISELVDDGRLSVDAMREMFAATMLPIPDMTTGEVADYIPLDEFVLGLYYSQLLSLIILPSIPGSDFYLEQLVSLVDVLPPPQYQTPNQMYAVRDSDTGIVTWHLPKIENEPK